MFDVGVAPKDEHGFNSDDPFHWQRGCGVGGGWGIEPADQRGQAGVHLLNYTSRLVAGTGLEPATFGL